MEHHVGIDISLKLSSVCVLDAAGKVVREAKVASEPEELVAFLRGLDVTIVRVGLEAGPLSQWLYDGFQAGGFEAVLLETRHVKAALSAMAIKTDRRDARGIAQLLRMGWYRPVHRKSVPSQEIRALLTARKQMQIKAMDLEQTLRGLLRGFGLQGWRREPRPTGGPHPRIGEREQHAGTDFGADADSARGPMARVRQAAP
jgi:transposase